LIAIAVFQASEGTLNKDLTHRPKHFPSTLRSSARSIKNLCGNNAETEKVLRKKKNKFETDLGNLIAKYDADMSEKQAMIDEMGQKYSKEKAEFLELQEHFDRVDANSATAETERKILAETAAINAAADKMLADAAAHVQKLVRGMFDRVIVAKLKKKKGGKKGKKGKKK
jgi:hypothetical protein